MASSADIAFHLGYFAIGHGDDGVIGDVLAFEAAGVYLTAGFNFFFLFQKTSLQDLIVHACGTIWNVHVIDFVGKVFGAKLWKRDRKRTQLSFACCVGETD